MTVRSSNGTYEFIDFREMAGGAYNETMYSSNINLSLYGGLASGVPGELRGLEYLHKKYGSKPWKYLMEPAIKVARYGFPVGSDLVRYIASTTNNSFLVQDPAWAIDFAPNGTLVKLGDTIMRKRYADTLETIAQYGPDAFYHGAIANATISALQATGGLWLSQIWRTIPSRSDRHQISHTEVSRLLAGVHHQVERSCLVL